LVVSGPLYPFASSVHWGSLNLASPTSDSW
jgi:hypothetical protein